MSSDKAKESRRPRRGWWWKAPILALLFVVAGANIALHFIPVGPLLEGVLTKELGKPFVIGRLNARAFPGAYITAYDVRFGEGDFMATADRLVVRGSLWKLLFKKIDIYHGEIFGFRVQLPPTLPEAVDRWNAMIDYIEGEDTPDDGGGWKLHIYYAEAADSRTYMADRLAMTGFVAVEEVTEPAKDFIADVRLAYFESNPALTGRAVLADRDEGDPTLTGTAQLRDFRVNDLGLPASFPAGRLDLDVTMDGPVPENLHFATKGVLDVPDAPGLSGAFTANAWVQETRFLVNDMDFSGPGMTLRGDLTSGPEGAFACEVTQAVAKGPGLTGLFRLLSAKDAGLEARGDGQLTVHGLLFGQEPDAELRFVSGEAILDGIDYALPTGEVAFDKLEGHASVEEGRLLLDQITGEGVTVSGIIEPHFGGDGVLLDLAGEIALNPARLAPWVDRETLPELSGTLEIERFHGTLGREGLPDDLSATAHLKDVSATVVTGTAPGPLEFDAVGGTVRYTGGAFELDGVGGERFALNGTLRPLDTDWALDLSGWADLNAGFIRLFQPESLSKLGGRMTFQRVAGTFADGLPSEDLVVEGKIENARGGLDAGVFTEQFENLNVTFSTKGDAIEVKGSLQLAHLGAVETSLRYVFTDQTLGAEANLDLAGLAGVFDDAGPVAGLAPLFQAFGRQTWTVSAALPKGTGSAWSVDLSCPGTPAFEGSFAFDGGAWPVRGDARTTLPFAAFAGMFPGNLRPNGEIALQFIKTAETSDFSMHGDLTHASLEIGNYLHKPVGGPAGFTLRGAFGVDEPVLQSALLHAYGQTLDVTLAPAVRIDAIALDLGPLEPLLPEEGMARGRVTGYLATEPAAARLELLDAGLGFSAAAKLDAVNGVIALNEGVFTCEALRLRGADSDCVLNARWEGGEWEARAEGDKLNLDAVLTLVNALTATFVPDSTEDAEEEDPGPPDGRTGAEDTSLVGHLTVQMQQLFYQRGRLDQVHAAARVTAGEILIEDLSCVPYSGSVTGSIRIFRKESPVRVATELAIADAEMRIVDETLFEQPRGLHGTGSGAVAAEFTFGSADEVLNSISGTVDLSLANGSYGQLGAATRALSLLRIVEFIRLKVPRLREIGLTYDRSTLRLEASDGVVSLRQFMLQSPSYEVNGEGSIDYPQDQMDVVFRVHLLEVLTGIISRVPLLGDAVDAVTSVTDLVVTARGSAREPDFVITPGAPPRRRNGGGR